MTEINTGSIDERGLIENLSRKGFDYYKSLNELVANSIDAGASCIEFKILQDEINIIDNGYGMNENSINNMFSLYYSNHSNDKSMGVSGLGAKAATRKLSNISNVICYTHKIDCPYYKITIPWNVIHTEGKYTGFIKLIEISRDEFSKYNEYDVGTTISFIKNSDLYNAIKVNFRQSDIEDKIEPEKLIGIVFGKFTGLITLSQYDDHKTYEIIKFNYFSGKDYDYYSNKSEIPITQYQNKDLSKGMTYAFNYKNKAMHFKKHGPGFSKKPGDFIDNPEWQKIGEFTLTVGFRKNGFFDYENPELINSLKGINSNHNYTGDDFYSKLDENFYGNCNLIRCNQYIGTIIDPDQNIATSRGTAESIIKTIGVVSELSYECFSYTNNPQDTAIGIQENKNQFDGTSLPKNLTRIIHHIKEMKGKEILDYFNKIIESKEPISEIKPTQISEVKQEPILEVNPEQKPTQILEIDKVLEVKPEPILEIKPKQISEVDKVLEVKPEQEHILEVKPEQEHILEVDKGLEVKPEQEPIPEIKPEEPIPEIKPEEPIPEIKPEHILEIIPEQEPFEEIKINEYQRNDNKCQTITVTHAKQCLQKCIKNPSFDTLLTNLIFQYMDCCAKEQITLFMSLIQITTDNKFNVLNGLINHRYPDHDCHDTSVILCGSEIAKYYKEHFTEL